MKRRAVQLRSVVLAAFLPLLPGCAVPDKPSASLLASADYGPPIAESDARRLADGFLAICLKDPGSRQVTWGPIEKGHERIPAEGDGQGWNMFRAPKDSDWVFGYRMMAGVNAKNSYGGYTGSKPYWFLFKDGRLAIVFTFVERPHGVSYEKIN